MSQILVTGGLGFIGHNVVRMLEQQGHDVVILDNETNYGIIPHTELEYLMSERRQHISTQHIYNSDLTQFSMLDYILNEHKIDTVIHLASYPRQKVVNQRPVAGSYTMVSGLLGLLEQCVKHKVKKFVYISSSMVYGDFEDQTTEDAVCNPLGQYGIMKLTGEWLVKDYAKRTGIDYVIVRPSAVYGPRDVEDRVVSKFMLAALRNQTINVNGASESLDFTYVEDTAQGIVLAATVPGAENDTYNITKSHSVSLLTAALTVVDIVGSGSIDVKDRDSNFPSRGALNIDRARTKLGYNPTVNIEQGFELYYDYFKKSVFWNPITA